MAAAKPRLPPLLSRAPVGGLRFVVLRVGEENVYSSRAVDKKGHTYEIRSDSAGSIILTDRTGEDTEHESIDAAETAAGLLNRSEFPLQVPKFKWTKHTWREARFQGGGYNTHEVLIAPACDVPFLGTGHFTVGKHSGSTTARNLLGWTGAVGAWSYQAREVPDLATACGIIDPYCDPSAGAYFLATKDQVGDLYRVLIKAANKGRKLYRVFPVLPDHERHAFGSLRQLSAWDSWLTSSRARKHWDEWGRKAKKGATYPAEYRIHNSGYEYAGPALFKMQEITAELKAGKLRYPKLLSYEKDDAGVRGPSHRARSVGEAVLVPSRWQELLYDEFMVETTRRGTLGIGTGKERPRMVEIGHALVEIVEYNDGDKPYVKSLGYFRSLSHEELDIKWGNRPGKKLEVKVYPGTWLTRIAEPGTLGQPTLPGAELSGQMEFGILPPR